MSGLMVIGLSITQEKAARLIVSGKESTDAEIAKSLRIKRSLLKEWKRTPKFKLRVLQLMDANVDLERAYRTKKVGKYLKPIYREIRKRLRDKEALEAYPLKELVRMMTVLHNELRQDGNFNRRFLEAGLKDYGENVPESGNSEEYEEEVNMNKVSDLYEERRKREYPDQKTSFSKR